MRIESRSVFCQIYRHLAASVIRHKASKARREYHTVCVRASRKFPNNHNTTRRPPMDIDEDFDVDETTSGDDGIEDDGQSLEANQSYKKLARYKKLGFHPQKEIYCNKYLPYAEHLDDESQRMLADVKEYLAVAVASREMVPAIANAVKRLIM